MYKYILICVITFVLGSHCSAHISSRHKTESYLLHYDKPAQYFEESLPLGNGHLGVLVYGGIAEERISLNDITLWTGEPDLTPWTPDAWQYLDSVRGLLQREDYLAANEANKLIQGHKSEIYQPLGTLYLTDLNISPQSEATDYQRSLSLNDAHAKVSYSHTGAQINRECFVSAPDSVIVVRISTTSRSGLNYRVRLSSLLPHASNSNGIALWSEGYVAYSTKPEQGKNEWFHYDANRGIHFRTELRIQAPDGCVKADTDSTLLIKGCKSATIIIANATSFNGPYKDPVTCGKNYKACVDGILNQAMKKSYSLLFKRHLADYQQLFCRTQINLGSTPDSIKQLPTDKQLRLYSEAYERGDNKLYENPDLEELYFQYGRYLLISSSRTKGVPANLQGLWNESLTPPWNSNYTVNINVEENYWHSETTALPEMHQSFLSWIMQLPKRGAITAKNYYGIDEGWCVCHNSDIWCMTNPTGYQQSSPEWACWPLGGAWVCTHLWEHYVFSQDRRFLLEAYPVMKGAADFLRRWMVERNGELITSPSTSPENHFLTPDGINSCTLYGGTADLAMIRELFIVTQKAALTVSDITLDNTDERLYADSLSHLIKLLHPYQIGHKGNLQEWYYDWEDADPKHRHQSHLFGLYPGHHINNSTPDLMKASARTLEIKGDRTTGWSSGWRVNLQARLGNADAAYHILRKLLSYVSPSNYHGADARGGGGTYPNLFDAHPPFQIDGNFGGTAGIVEMLVRSTEDGTVTLLPALPKQWAANGSISGVRLRGGYELSFSWADGKVQSLSVHSLRQDAGTLKFIGPDINTDISIAAGATKKITIK